MSLPVAILAGGVASRLRPLTGHVPKSPLEVAGKPFIIHQFEWLRRNQIDRVVLCVGHLGEKIRETLGDGSRFRVRIDYVFDGPEPLGTGGALKNALPLLDDAFFVLYGDSYLEIDYQAVQRAFVRGGKLGLMTVYRNEGRWDRSNLLLADDRILRYDKRQPTPDMKHIDYGLGALRREAFCKFPEHQFLDLAEIYQHLIALGQLAGFEATRRFYEIGSPAGLEETRAYLSARREEPAYARRYLNETCQVLSQLDSEAIERLAQLLRELRAREGRRGRLPRLRSGDSRSGHRSPHLFRGFCR